MVVCCAYVYCSCFQATQTDIVIIIMVVYTGSREDGGNKYRKLYVYYMQECILVVYISHKRAGIQALHPIMPEPAINQKGWGTE